MFKRRKLVCLHHTQSVYVFTIKLGCVLCLTVVKTKCSAVINANILWRERKKIPYIV